jgi:hypothetical protein
MNKPNEQYAYFTVVGDFDPFDITARVGVQPTKSWRKGDLHPQNRLERKFSRWSLHSTLEQTRPIEEHIDDVLAQLAAHSSEFKIISSEFGGVLEIVAYFNSDYPGLFISKSQIAAMADFGLEADFDFYYIYSDRREDT